MRVVNNLQLLFKNHHNLLEKLCILSVVILLLLLPYYLFDGRLFLGGDDTRLHYIYPSEFLRNLSFYSWVNISSLPTYLPNHHLAPILLFSILLEYFFDSKIFVFNLFFSAPFIIGFVYMRKFISQLVDNDFETSFILSLIYISSPIVIVSQMYNFLFSMYLVALFPLVANYFLNFLITGTKINIFKIILWSILLSFVFFAIQWIAALIICIVFGFLILFIVEPIKSKYIQRTLVFIIFLFFSQLFWVLPFFMSFILKGNTYLGDKVTSLNFINDFATTVNATATGNIIYPLFTFYQREIALQYDWQVIDVFIRYYDKIFIFGIVYLIIIFFGIFKFNKVLDPIQKRYFIFFFSSFILVLFFSTVNIGFLKEVFIFSGNIPGFAIFRNFTDKFALSFIFIYSTFLSLCFYTIKKNGKFYNFIKILLLFVIVINFIPVKSIVVSPMWQTIDIKNTINLPSEYKNFIYDVRSRLDEDVNVIAFPQNIASYAVITEENGKNVYVGTSPFKFLSNINDLSGESSYPSFFASEIRDQIVNHNSIKLLKTFEELNIGYLMLTRNIPNQVLESYLFDNEYLKHQNIDYLKSITEKELIRSGNGNYSIYKLSNSPDLISSSTIFKYEKISSVLYKISIKNLKTKDELIFRESFHSGWRLYLIEKGIDRKNIIIPPIKNEVFRDSHTQHEKYGNRWTVNANEIKSEINDKYYSVNNDGSINIDLYLYFFPQNYFYIGIVISGIAIILGLLILYRK